MNTAELLDRARERAGNVSDYRIAKTLGVSTTTVSQWRSARSYPDLLHVFQLAELAGMSEVSSQIAASLELDRAARAARPEQAEAWRQVLERIGGIAAAVMLSVGLGGLTTGAPQAQARVAGEAPATSSNSTTYTS
jgi:transcriptional regulator with XRE-family HTH domain